MSGLLLKTMESIIDLSADWNANGKTCPLPIWYGRRTKRERGVFLQPLPGASEESIRKAEEIIGLSYEQFRQVIVLPQGQFEKFLTSDSADKEKILTSIFGEEKWQAVAQLMFEEATERRQQLKSLQEQISNSLQEEACETLAELEAVIAQKKERLRRYSMH